MAKKGYNLPSLEKRIEFELAKRGWDIANLRDRLNKITGEKYTPSRVGELKRSLNPQTKTLNLLAEALGMDVKKFYEEEL